MKFILIDKITKLDPGKELTAIKTLTMAEEYLADHFPSFPVMPGVLMLEAMTQASAWLLRISDDFKHSIVVLKEAKNAKYGYFVEPGQILEIHTKLIERNEREAIFKASGQVDGKVNVRVQLTLEYYNLRDANPAMAENDKYIIDDMQRISRILLHEKQAG